MVLALNVGSDPQEDARQSHLVGKAAPDFNLPNLSGGRVKLADIAGKSAIVNFWNSWCIPCQEEEPLLKQFYAAHKDDPDFAMIGIVRDDETGTVQRVREGRRRRLDDRARSEVAGGARLRHSWTTGDLRHLAEWGRGCGEDRTDGIR